MSRVGKDDLLAVCRSLWGSSPNIDDQAKLVVAEECIESLFSGGPRLTVQLAGGPVKTRLGSRWMTSRERVAAGLPTLSGLLEADPYFELHEGTPHALITLRVNRLAPLAAQLRGGSGGGGGGAGSSTSTWHGGAPSPEHTAQPAAPPPRAATPADEPPAAPLVLQPPAKLLLDVLVDATWPPQESREAAVKGQLAKHIIQSQLELPGDVRDAAKAFHAMGSAAGSYVLRWWPTQPFHDPNSKPYRTLADALANDPYWRTSVNDRGTPVVSLLFGELLSAGGGAAAQRLLDAADAVWPPAQGRETWLRGRLAKWLITAGFQAAVLRQVLTVGPEAPTVFRIDIAQAGEYLRRCWTAGGHPYDAASPPWSALKNVLAGDRFLRTEPSPDGKRGCVHVTLDLKGMLRLHATLPALAAGGARTAAASAAPAAPARPAPEDEEAALRAELAALEALQYHPPAAMQRWWPEHRPALAGHTWAEVAIRLIDPGSDDNVAQVAEMVQHLEISPLMAVTCATYKSHPHLLSFFAPHASVGSALELPAAVYLLDVMHPKGPGVAQVLELVRPVLASRENVKVCHSSKQWTGQLEKAFGVRLVGYFDTQQAHYVSNCLRHQAGRTPHLTPGAVKHTAEVSLSSLLRNYHFHHPVRHLEASKEAPRLWQERPLSGELVTCAAADVVYLLPLMAAQGREIKTAAAEARQHQAARPGTRAAALLSSLPPELSSPQVLASLAGGVEGRSGPGSVSHQRLQEWALLPAFHQEPLHDFNFRLGESYGSLRPGGYRPPSRGP